MGELLSVGALALAPPGSPALGVARTLAAPFFKASCYQALWCAAFRPRYFLPPSLATSYLPFCLLSLTSLNLLECVRRAGARRKDVPALQHALLFFPISLHAGWTAAASLVNLNGSFAYNSLRDDFKARPELTERIRR